MRHEDLTRLSFAGGEFDIIVSLEVFEHVPSYGEALSECARCLASGGRLLFTVPFANTERNVVRCCKRPDATLEDLLEPEYHPDPHRAEGNLCFYHFGWELLDELRERSFEDACALLYWSRELAYLGVEQIQFLATRAATATKASTI